MKQFFWLHIKKSAGHSVTKALKPYYVEVDKLLKPKNFIQANYNEYNDILNNFRTNLGNYQFKRALFAKEYLYKEKWDSMFSFAFCREPIDRCISMFYYLFWGKSLRNRLYTSLRSKKIFLNNSYAFDYFLELISSRKYSNSNFKPIDLHFTTHTNPMWDDITDNNGNLLLSKVFRLDDFTEGINYVLKKVLNKNINSKFVQLNVNPQKGSFYPNKFQIKKIQELYKEDFELYETISQLKKY